jgi:hypothetical protein
MRFSKSLWKSSSAFVAMTALILIAGGANAQFFDDYAYEIDPDSPRYDWSDGYLDGSGSSSGAGVDFFCQDADNLFYIGCETDHPDSVNLSANQGKVNQTKKDNNAEAFIDVYEMGGIIEDSTYYLSCDRVQVKGMANYKNDKIQTQCILKGCEIPASLTVGQIQSASDCADNAEKNGDLGKSVQTLKLNNKNLINGRIKSKGYPYWD